jgi:murein L,D-transpeptidase YcbB/YkuD
MSTGRGMLEMARKHIGQQYENVLVPKNNPNWRGPWDCAEFMSWLVFQDAGFLYGCINNNINPAVADAYTGAWQQDSSRLGNRVSVEHAAATVGGIVLRFPPAPGRMGHIAICDGQGGTVEAKGRAFGVVADTVHGRRWNTGVLLPDIHYDIGVTPLTLIQPTKVYFIGGPNMDPKVVRDIQQALLDAEFDPGPIDGIYGAKTAAAVGAFQQVKGLVVDGEVGPQTAKELGIKL